MDRLKSSERRMKIILMLQESKTKLTATDLADKFGVSKRTIFRDFKVLSEINVPVTWDEEEGYGVVRGYKIPPIMFTSKEIATILVGLNFVKSQVDQELSEDAAGVELKIKNVLPDELKAFMSSLENKMIVDPFMYFGSEKRKGGNWYQISSAISMRKTLKFKYQSKSESNITNRLVDPRLLVYYHDHWNLIGYSHKRGSIRNFILERIKNLEITAEQFVIKEEMNAEALIFRSEGQKHLVIADIGESSVNRFKANLPTKIIKLSQISLNLFRAEFYFDNLDYLNEWLLQFSDNVKIVKPKVLIDKRKSLLTSMIND